MANWKREYKATWKREFKLPWRKAGLLISMIKWTRTSRLTIKNSLSGLFGRASSEPFQVVLHGQEWDSTLFGKAPPLTHHDLLLLENGRRKNGRLQNAHRATLAPHADGRAVAPHGRDGLRRLEARHWRAAAACVQCLGLRV